MTVISRAVCVAGRRCAAPVWAHRLISRRVFRRICCRICLPPCRRRRADDAPRLRRDRRNDRVRSYSDCAFGRQSRRDCRRPCCGLVHRAVFVRVRRRRHAGVRAAGRNRRFDAGHAGRRRHDVHLIARRNVPFGARSVAPADVRRAPGGRPLANSVPVARRVLDRHVPGHCVPGHCVLRRCVRTSARLRVVDDATASPLFLPSPVVPGVAAGRRRASPQNGGRCVSSALLRRRACGSASRVRRQPRGPCGRRWRRARCVRAVRSPPAQRVAGATQRHVCADACRRVDASLRARRR